MPQSPFSYVEDTEKIRITDLKNDGFFSTRKLSVLPVAIIYQDGDSIVITRRFGQYRVGLGTRPCNMGGYRYYFICPTCNKMVSILYFREKCACRKCNNLVYLTQYLTPRNKFFYKMLKEEIKFEKIYGTRMPRGRPRYKNLQLYVRRGFENLHAINAFLQNRPNL